MGSKSRNRTWQLAQLTALCGLALLPVLQFLDANPYFKFRYGFDEKLLAVIVLVFLVVPFAVFSLLGRTGGSEAPRGLLRTVFGLELFLFASQLSSTTLHTSAPWIRFGAAASCLILGSVALWKRPREFAWSLALASVVVVPYTAFQVVRHWWWIPKPPAAASMEVSGLEPGKNDIYIFLLDGCTLTSDFLGEDNTPDATHFPNLHRFVTEDAVWFYDAVSNGPETLLSLPCMFTGKLYMSRRNGYLAKEPTLFSILKPRYAVRVWLHTKSAFCTDEDFQRCYPFEGQILFEPMRILVESWAFISSFRLTRTSYTIDKLDEATFHREAFVDDFLARVADESESPKFYTIQLFDRGLQGLKDFDALLAEFRRVLEERGRYDQAIIAIVSDHGLSGADAHSAYGRWAEQNQRLYRVPFALKPPGRGQGRSDPYPAQGIDITPTILARVLRPEDLRSQRFDGVDVLSEKPQRTHWINLISRGVVHRFSDPTGRASGLEAVPLHEAALPTAPAP